MPDITYLQVVNEIRRLAAEQPDFVYESADCPGQSRSSCVYVERVAPNSYKKSCIVGHALINLGVPPQDLVYDPGKVPGAGPLLALLLGASHCKADTIRRRWVRTVQSLQDRNYPWGQAVRMADSDNASYEAQDDA